MPEVGEGPEGRRGQLALDWSACTSCLACVRDCPDWCIDLTARLEVDPGSGRPRRVLVLEQFTVDYDLCMYCGICIDVCPPGALSWTSELLVARPARSARR